jgi:hypothetical protein
MIKNHSQNCNFSDEYYIRNDSIRPVRKSEFPGRARNYLIDPEVGGRKISPDFWFTTFGDEYCGAIHDLP